MWKTGLKKLLIALPFSYFVFTQDPSFYASAMIQIPKLKNAISYNIYYKEDYRFTFNHIIKNIPGTIGYFIVNDLRENISYDYEIAAINAKGNEFWISPVEALKN